MWWWERTRPREQTLVLVGGDEKQQVSVRFGERQLGSCALDPEARAEITRRLITAIEEFGANPPDSEGF